MESSNEAPRTATREANPPTETLPKRRRVVYLLGSGFSAPLDLPVMSNWMAKAQAIVYLNPEDETAKRATDSRKKTNLKDFWDIYRNVINTIEQLSIGNNYYASNLLNMEDLFSIVWMRAALKLNTDSYLQGGQSDVQTSKDKYIDYIVHMINHYTPSLEPVCDGKVIRLRSNWRSHLFGENELWNLYGLFFAALFNLIFKVDQGSGEVIKSDKVSIECNPEATADYSIVTLNYDRVPNLPIEYIRKTYLRGDSDGVKSVRSKVNYIGPPLSGEGNVEQQNGGCVPLAKIHGDIDDRKTIVPPIYSKTVDDNTDKYITKAWELAAKALGEATDLRIIGYSLPITDTYMKYLLRAVITESKLQNIHVISRDSSGEAQKRYNDFICCKNYEFVNGDVCEYLRHHMSMYEAEDTPNTGIATLKLNKLEKAHNAYMKKHANKTKS